MTLPPLSAMLKTICLLLLLKLGMFEGAAASNDDIRRRAQVVNVCGPSQCYIKKYGQCFHSTSYECTSMPEDPVVTPSPTPRPVVQWIETDIPALFQFRMFNVDDDYSLSSSDKARILTKIWSLVEATLDKSSSQIISVESLGEHIGSRRLRSPLRGGGKRRLNRTLYLPIVVTLRVREDMVDMMRTFVFQVLYDKLSALMIYLKSLDSKAFGNFELSVEELNLADMDFQSKSTSSNTITITNTTSNSNTTTSNNSETKTETESTTISSGSGVPIWVWIIIAVAVTLILVCFLLCMCRAGWCDCYCCTGKDTKDEFHEVEKQLAIARWKRDAIQNRSGNVSRVVAAPLPVRARHNNRQKRKKNDAHKRRRRNEVRRSRSDGAIRYDDSNNRRKASGRRRHERRRNTSANITSDSVGARQLDSSQRTRQPSSELGSESSSEPKPDPEQVHPILLSSHHSGGRDPSVQHETALVVYNASLEPEAPKIDDLPNVRGDEIVVFDPTNANALVVYDAASDCLTQEVMKSLYSN